MKCHDCKHKRDIPGDCHVACRFGIDEPLVSSKAVKLNPVGVENGWCRWPWNFDPVWVECKAFVKAT